MRSLEGAWPTWMVNVKGCYIEMLAVQVRVVCVGPDLPGHTLSFRFSAMVLMAVKSAV